LAVQPRPELQSVERVLDEDAQLVRASRHPPRPSAWPARAPPRPTSRARTARRGSRAPGPASRLRSRRAGRARPARPRAARAAPRPSTAIPPCSCSLPVDAVEDAVDEPSRLARRILLGEGDGLVDHDTRRDLSRVELVDGDAEDVPLDGAEPVGRPPRL